MRPHAMARRRVEPFSPILFAGCLPLSDLLIIGGHRHNIFMALGQLVVSQVFLRHREIGNTEWIMVFRNSL
jgi:hypothetical protein